jgi:hypothetical protein
VAALFLEKSPPKRLNCLPDIQIRWFPLPRSLAQQILNRSP